VAVGVNVTLMAQLAPAARLAPQLFVCEKSPPLVPVIVMLVRVNRVVPLLVSVTAWAALLVPTDWLTNVIEAGVTLTEDVAPVPERFNVCGLPAASSAIVSVAVRAPVAAGVKVTLMVQLALGARLAPQVFVCVKSPLLVPAIVILERFNEAPPVLVSVTI
jgi:hypothetical protein